MMHRTAFVTPALSILLDLVRGVAALLVLGGHAVQLGLYSGPYPFGPSTQHNAVVVFFVLSGLVIAHSVQSRAYTLREYAIARAARIVPVAWFALAFAALAFLFITSQGRAPGVDLGYFNVLDMRTLIRPALFLSETGPIAGPVWNPPYWSLVYEVWFYILFGAAFFLKGRLRWPVVLMLAYLAGWRIVVMLPIWLLGAALARYGTVIEVKGRVALLLALAGAACLAAATHWAADVHTAMFALHAEFGYRLKFSEYFVTDHVFAVGIAIGFILARPLADRYCEQLERGAGPIRWLAGFSFSLYVLHWPMLLILSSYGISAGGNPLAFAALCGGIIGACALFAQVIELRNRDIRAWLDRMLVWPGRRPAAA